MKRILIGITLIVGSLTTSAQDIQFSQFLNTPQLVNPAMTGAHRAYERVMLNYRTQWGYLGVPYKTMGFSADLPLFKYGSESAYLGLGIFGFKDEAGDSQLGRTQAGLSIAGILPMDEVNNLSVGIQAAFAQRSINYSALQWGNQYSGIGFDENLVSGEENSLTQFSHFDLSAGAFWEALTEYKSFTGGYQIFKVNAGVAYYHANRAKDKLGLGEIDRINGLLIATTSARIDIPSTKISIVPSGIFMMQASLYQVTAGGMVRFKLSNGNHYTGVRTESAVSFGAHYRLKDAFIPSFKLEIKDFELSLSYDANTSELARNTSSSSAIEFGITYINHKGALYQRR